jgi:hypothetical protein
MPQLVIIFNCGIFVVVCAEGNKFLLETPLVYQDAPHRMHAFRLHGSPRELIVFPGSCGTNMDHKKCAGKKWRKTIKWSIVIQASC